MNAPVPQCQPITDSGHPFRTLVEMARAAQHDDRQSTGALYGKLADRIQELEGAAMVADKHLDALGYGEMTKARKALRAALKANGEVKG